MGISEMIKYLLFTLFLVTLFSTELKASTAATCNTADVQSAINSAGPGQTVNVPAGTCTWTTGVTISNGINLVGAGSGRIVAYSSDALALTTGSQTINILGAQIGGTPPAPIDPAASTLPASMKITNGEALTVYEVGNRQNFLAGTVTSYNSGVLVMNITSTGGTCGTASSGTSPSNCARWYIATTPNALTQTIIHNNATNSTMFNVTENASSTTSISGFHIIRQATTVTNSYDFSATYSSSGKPVLFHDNWISETNISCSGSCGVLRYAQTNRGVVWNCSFDSTPFQGAMSVFSVKGDNPPVGSPSANSWSTVSTFGANDTTGTNNVYFETNGIFAFLPTTDYDDNSRSVVRYNLLDNSSSASHGTDSSQIGLRHFEFYNNLAVYNGYNNGTTFNLGGRYMFLRGGTFAIHDNVLPNLAGSDYGSGFNDITVEQETLRRSTGYAQTKCWGSGYTTHGQYWQLPRQVGYGYVTGTGTVTSPNNGVKGASQANGYYVGDPEPAYIWNNSQTSGGSYFNLSIAYSDFADNDGGNSCVMAAGQSSGYYDNTQYYVRTGKEVINSGTAKPGYTPYTYPHPLRQTLSSGTGPAAPTDLAASVN
jgi:hypothetical protein